MVILVVFSEIGSVFPVEYDFAGLPLTIKRLFLMFYTRMKNRKAKVFLFVFLREFPYVTLKSN